MSLASLAGVHIWKRLALCMVALVASGCGLAADLAVRPHHRSIGPPPSDGVAVTIPVAGHTPVAGWTFGVAPGQPAVVVLHGFRYDRRQVLDRVRLLREAGFGVLAVDLPAHGESHADRVTFGWSERHAAVAAVGWLRERVAPARVGASGFSMGGAALALAGSSLGADAVVLEGVYSAFDHTTRLRLDRFLQPFSPWFTREMLARAPGRMGVAPDSLRPVDGVRQLRAPVLVVTGADDVRAPPDDARALFAAVRGERRLWLVPGLGHASPASRPDAYRRHVVGFLREHLAG